jgi:hypothetical protein
MNNTATTRGARKLTVAGLAVGAIGIVLQRLAGVDMPIVPPGLVMLVVAAALIGFTRWKWAPVVGVLIAAAELAAVSIGGLSKLTEVEQMGVFLSTWVRAVGVTVALLAGVVATVSGLRRKPAEAARI